MFRSLLQVINWTWTLNSSAPCLLTRSEVILIDRLGYAGVNHKETLMLSPKINSFL